MRRALAALAGLAVLAACEVGGSPEPSVGTGTEAPGSPPSTVATQEPTVLDPVVLTASLDERPAPWQLVTTIPFGPRRMQLGYVRESPGFVAGVPASFAVDGEGDIWILDFTKERLVRFTPTGELGSVVERYRVGDPWYPRDLRVDGSRVVVLRQHLTTLAAGLHVEQDGEAVPLRRVAEGGDGIVVYHLVPGTVDLVGEKHGFAASEEHQLGSGTESWVRIDPGTGEATEVGGIELPDGVVMDLAKPVDERFRTLHDRLDVTFMADTRTSILPLRFRLVRELGGRPLRHALAAWVQGAMPHGLAAFVRVVSSGRDEDLALGGWWYLQVADDGSALVWERLPEPGIPTEAQTRFLTTAPDGSVYLMLLGPRGAGIYRR